MSLPPSPPSSNPLLKHILRLLNKQSMKINRIPRNPALSIILTKNKFRSLFVIRVHFARMFFALEREFVGEGAVAGFVGLAGSVEA